MYLGFDAQGPFDEKAVSDTVFIQDRNHNIAVFTSTLSNSVVLVDMSKDSPMVTDAEEITSNHGKYNNIYVCNLLIADICTTDTQKTLYHSYTGRGARRNVVWAVGTDYVWVD